MTHGRMLGSTITSACPPSSSTTASRAVGHRLEREAQGADVQDPDGGRQRGERHLGRQPGGRRGALVEAVAGAAGLVELGERERRRLVGAHDGVEAHAVGGEHPLELGAEAVGRQAAQIGDRLAEARRSCARC